MQDAASKAELAKKKAELAEAEEDLEDTISDHKLELSQDALTGMKDALQDAFDDRWENIHSDLGTIADLMSAANELTSSSAQAINQNLSELLKYYGVDPSTVGIESFAKGTKHVGYTGLARTQEDGGEIVLKDGSVLVPVKPNDAIIASTLTDNLLAMARGESYIPNMATPEVVKPTINIMPEKNGGGNVYNNYDSLIHVDGNVDKNIVTDIKQVGKELLKDRSFMQGTYNFTTGEIVRDARKVGVKV